MTASLKRKPLDLTHVTDTWHMTDIRPTVDQYTTDSWPIYHRQLTNITPTRDRYLMEMRLQNVNWHSADSWLLYWPTIAWLSTDIWLTINWLSTDYQPTIDRLSADIYRSTIDRLPIYRSIYRLRLPTVNMIRIVFQYSSYGTWPTLDKSWWQLHCWQLLIHVWPRLNRKTFIAWLSNTAAPYKL